MVTICLFADYARTNSWAKVCSNFCRAAFICKNKKKGKKVEKSKCVKRHLVNAACINKVSNKLSVFIILAECKFLVIPRAERIIIHEYEDSFCAKFYNQHFSSHSEAFYSFCYCSSTLLRIK